jgi:propanol-preferring alcohol dehydrogenase
MGVPKEMRAMVLEKVGQPLRERRIDVPRPGRQELLIRVDACGVCRTDLHIVDGELGGPNLPLILGHEIVGAIAATGEKANRFSVGEVVGVPWLGWTCGRCRYCKAERENLCDNARFTGYTIDGGYAEYALAHQDFCFRLPKEYRGAQGAPLLCAGLIGYRSYRMTGDAVRRLGLYGFGAAAHILAQIAVYQGRELYAFTRPGDTETQAFARRLGAVWAGDSDVEPPEKLDAAIIFAPVGDLVPAALRATAKGGVVVCGGIHMSDIPGFPYRILWEERVVRSVANLDRRDGREFFEIASKVPIKTEARIFPLEHANEALDRLRAGRIEGAAVLQIE